MNVIDEYLVKLGTTVDQAGFARFSTALREASMAVDASAVSMARSLLKTEVELVSGFAAIGGAAVGLADKVAMADQEYRLFALHMYMSKDAARSLKVAMDALGQPMENLAWDAELRERTHQLIADQRAMAAGGGYDEQMRKIRDIRFEFTRMEVEVKYLGMHVVSDFMKALGLGPDDLLKNLRRFNDWVTKHLPEISKWVVTKFIPVWTDVKMIMRDTWRIVMDLATVFDNLIGLLSGDATVTGAANFDKLSTSIIHVVHWLAEAVHLMTQFQFLLLGMAAGAPFGPIGIAVGGLVGDILDLMRTHDVGPWKGGHYKADEASLEALIKDTAGAPPSAPAQGSGASSQSTTLAAQARQLAQAVAARTGANPAYIWSQWAQETGNFTHLGAANNLAGINVPGGNGTQYRSFSSLAEFGDYYSKLIGPGGRYSGVAGAGSAADFASVLKRGGYYTGPEADYARNMAAYSGAYGAGRGGAAGSSVTVGHVTINVNQRPGEDSKALASRIKATFADTANKQVQRNLQEFNALSYSYGG